MQCMYLGDTCVHRDLRCLRDIGIQDGSVIDFSVDEEITTLKCHWGERVFTRNRSERCLLLDVLQDISHVWTG